MNYKVKVNPLATYSASEKIFNLAKSGPVNLPFIIFYNEKKREFEVYAEDLAPENRAGRIDEFAGKTIREIKQSPEIAANINSILSGDYTLQITGVNAGGKFLDAVLSVSEKDEVDSATGEKKELSEAWEKALALGEPFTPHFREKVTRFFDINNVPVNIRILIVSNYTVPTDEEGNILPLYEPDDMYFPGNTKNERSVYFENYVNLALKQALVGNPTIYQGPKSVGKNFLAEWIAFSNGWTYREVSASKDDTIWNYVGDKTIDNSGSDKLTIANAKSWLAYQREGAGNCLARAAEHEYWSRYNESMRFVVEDTEFKKWARQKTGKSLLMVNEINFGNPNVLAAIFNRVAEDRELRFIDVQGEGRLYFDDSCVLVASMNVDYVGTTELNEAMRSRFGVIEMQPATTIKDLLKDKTENRFGKGILPNRYYEACNSLYTYMLERSPSGGNNISQYGDKAISIRGFVRALKDVSFETKLSPKNTPPTRALSRALNIHLRDLGDTVEEQMAISSDINDHCGNL